MIWKKECWHCNIKIKLAAWSRITEQDHEQKWILRSHFIGHLVKISHITQFWHTYIHALYLLNLCPVCSMYFSNLFRPNVGLHPCDCHSLDSFPTSPKCPDDNCPLGSTLLCITSEILTLGSGESGLYCLYNLLLLPDVGCTRRWLQRRAEGKLLFYPAFTLKISSIFTVGPKWVVR